LNSFDDVFNGTNCKAPSILTGVECVGDPSTTHFFFNFRLREEKKEKKKMFLD
jgi:hypothetical protein